MRSEEAEAQEQESTLEEGASGSAWLGCSRRKFRAGDESDYVDA